MIKFFYFTLLGNYKNKNKFEKKNSFLGLMKKFRVHEYKPTTLVARRVSPYAVSMKQFKKYYSPLLGVTTVYEYTDFWGVNNPLLFNTLYKSLLHYYSSLCRVNLTSVDIVLPRIFFQTFTINNFISFSKPRRQLFFLFFKKKPIFVFTGGLMRIVMNEKRKSSKRLYKVATSLIKLSTILLSKKHYMSSCYLKLTNLGTIRTRILQMFARANLAHRIQYILVKYPLYMNAQKYATRRAVKKYVKKRFKLQ